MMDNIRASLARTNGLNTAAFLWIALALASLYPAVVLLNASLPLFTVIWLIVPLIALLVTRRSEAVGIRAISRQLFLRYAAMNMGLLALSMLLVEPWSHTYQHLLNMAVDSQRPDVTFAWLVRYPPLTGTAGMLVYSGLVTLFGEELFFRGWLLHLLLKRMRPVWAVALQALLFTIPQTLAALFMAPLQAALYVVIYSFLSIGCIGGWAAWKTQSIWPSLVSAAIMNLVFVIFLL